MAARETARPALTEDQAEALAGTRLGEDSYDRLVRDDADLYAPGGEPLLVFRRNALSRACCAAAYPALRSAAATSFNRGYASGRGEGGRHEGDGRTIAEDSPTRWRPLKRGGEVSNTSYADAVESGIVGYFDRNGRFPFCRTTAFNVAHPDRFAAALPFFREVDRVFARELPDRYAAQQAAVKATSPDFVIHGTAFTTVTVNRNWQTAVHQDRGDLKAGFGNLVVFRAGRYAGGYLVLPRWRVAVDVGTRDVLLMDVHQWHGNTPIVGVPGRYERLSCVLYYRERMRFCGSAAEELEFAKRRPRGAAVLRADPRRPGGPTEDGPA